LWADADLDLDAALAALRNAGYQVDRVEHSAGRPELGAAALAAIGSRLVKSWSAIFQSTSYRSAVEKATDETVEKRSDAVGTAEGGKATIDGAGSTVSSAPLPGGE